MQKLKLSLIISSIVFLSAGCNIWGGGQNNVSGVVKTINGGADWSFTNKLVSGASSTTESTIDAANISLLSFGSESTEKIYAASYNSGLLVSEDSGSTWKTILSKINVYDFAEDIGNTNKLYAVGSYGGKGKVLVTVDNGASWQEIYSEATNDDYVRSIVQNPSNAKQLFIGMNSGNIYMSADSGASWKIVNRLGAKIQRLRFLSGKLYVLSVEKGLAVSENLGKDFSNLTSPLVADTSIWGITNFSDNKVSEFYAYAISNLNSQTIYVTTDLGLYVTHNYGKSWLKLVLPVKSKDTRTRAVAVSPGNDSIVYTSIGSQIYKSLDGGTSWQTQGINTTGFINTLLVNPYLNQIVYGGVYIGK